MTAQQPSLPFMRRPSAIPAAPTFRGDTFNAALDGPRLGTQLRRVYDHLRTCGEWQTLRELEDATGYPQASISARLRDLRRDECGGHVVKKRRRGMGRSGTWEYRLVA